jgi:hypothetical protein
MIAELHRVGGRVTDADGSPVAEAWVTLPDLGRWSSSNADGRYTIMRVPPGEHTAQARTRDGIEGQATFTVPGGAGDIVIGAKRRERGAK